MRLRTLLWLLLPIVLGLVGYVLSGADQSKPFVSATAVVLWGLGLLSVPFVAALILPRTSRWRALALAVLALLMMYEGGFTAALPSLPALIVGLVVLALGFGLFYWSLFFSPLVTRLPPLWKKIGQGGAVTLLTALIVVVVAMNYSMGPTKQMLQDLVVDRYGRLSNTSDEELGWAPRGHGTVGQRLHVVDPDRAHIVFLGDSIVLGTGVEQNETFVHHLGQMLPQYQALNAATSGWSIDQYYLYLLRILPQIRPRLVVVGLFAGNDYETTGLEWNWGTSKPLFTFEDGELQVANRAQRCIDGLSRSLLFRLLWQRKQLAQNLIDFFCKPRQLSWAETDRVIPALLRAIRQKAAEAGAKTVFVVLPDRGELRISGEPFGLYKSRYADLIRILKQEQLPYIDVAEAFAALDEKTEPALFLDPGHYTPAGHRFVAEYLRPLLVPFL